LARCESKYQLEENIQMQKKIIALAIAAAFSAPAFADTTVYGVVDAALAHISADGTKSDTQAVSGGLASSRLGVKSVEDIGDMKAVVVLEYGLDTMVAAPSGSGAVTCAGAGCPANAAYSGAAGLTARQQMLALAGGFGTFAAGYLQTTGYDWAVKFDPMAGSSVSPLQSMAGYNLVGSKSVASRAQRALAYISPDMSGVTVAVNYSTDLLGLGNLGQAEGSGDTKETAALLSVTYSGGPLSVGGVYAKVSTPTGATFGSGTALSGIKEYALGASYDLSVVKLFATYQSMKIDDAPWDDTSKVYSLSAVAPVGSGAVAFSYAKEKWSCTGCTDGGGNGYTLAYLQGLSKVTTMYVAVSKVSNDTGNDMFTVDNNILAGAVKVSGSSTLIAAGLNKKF
jgi:predicted porin